MVPFNNDIYYQKRPGLAVPKDEVLRLNGDLGFNPSLQALRNVRSGLDDDH